MTLAAMAVGFLAASFAVTQGEFAPGTKTGLVSLILAILLFLLFFYTGVTFVHLTLPAA